MLLRPWRLGTVVLALRFWPHHCCNPCSLLNLFKRTAVTVIVPIKGDNGNSNYCIILGHLFVCTKVLSRYKGSIARNIVKYCPVCGVHTGSICTVMHTLTKIAGYFTIINNINIPIERTCQGDSRGVKITLQCYV